MYLLPTICKVRTAQLQNLLRARVHQIANQETHGVPVQLDVIINKRPLIAVFFVFQAAQYTLVEWSISYP